MQKILLLVLSLSATDIFGASIYKWVDEQGVTHYSASQPPTGQAQEVQVQPAPPADAGRGSPGETSFQEQWSEVEKRRAARREEEKRKAEMAAPTPREAQRLCSMARDTLEVLQEQRPVYHLNDKGERVYVEDEARPAAIESAKAAVKSYCGKQ